jgi:hypothetical protein
VVEDCGDTEPLTPTTPQIFSMPSLRVTLLLSLGGTHSHSQTDPCSLRVLLFFGPPIIRQFDLLSLTLTPQLSIAMLLQIILANFDIFSFNFNLFSI